MKSKLMMQALFGVSILLGSDGLGLAVEMMEDNPPGKSAVPVDPVEEAYTLVNRVDSMRDLEVPMVKLGCIPALRSLAPGIKREKIALSPDEVVEILRKVKVDGMPIRLGMDVRVLRATASLRAALGPRKLVTLPPDVARLDDDLDKLKETAGDPKLSLSACVKPSSRN